MMFPRIMTVRKPNKTYQYLVISESVCIPGKGSTTRNIANLGNIEKFQSQDIADMIDGLIRFLLRHKDEIELAIFERLRNLFSVNVKLTFYDITSSYFYSDSCPLGKNGYSRDNRSDLEQIVIGVVTSFEGYPIKHYVFEGNTKDETTVTQVVAALKADYLSQRRAKSHCAEKARGDVDSA